MFAKFSSLYYRSAPPWPKVKDVRRTHEPNPGPAEERPLSSVPHLSWARPDRGTRQAVVVIAGPDKGRVGTLLGVEKGSCIVKLSTRELKVIDISKIAKQQ